MANLFEAPAWEAGIYQLETTDRALAGPDGILNVPFKQLANRTLALRKRLQQLRLNVLDFGAQPEPAFDNTLAFTQALVAAAAEGGGTVYVPPGRYEFSGSLVLPDQVVLEGAGANRTQLVLQDAGPAEAHLLAEGVAEPLLLTLTEPALAGQRVLRLSAPFPLGTSSSWLLAGADAGSFSGAATLPGEFVAPVLLAADFQAGSAVLSNLNQAGVLRPGDAVQAEGLLPPGTTVVSVGESQAALSAAALQTAPQAPLEVPTVLVLAQPLRAAYTPGLAGFYTLEPLRVGLQGLSLLSVNEKPALSVRVAEGCHFEDLLLEGPQAAQLRFGLCRQLTLKQVRARDTETGPSAGAVLTLQGCEQVLLERLSLETQRVGVSLLPWDGGAALLNRQVKLEGSVLRALGVAAALQAGANTDGLLLADSQVQGTLVLGGRDLVLQGCQLRQARVEAPLVIAEGLRAGVLRLEGCQLEGHSLGGGANQALVSCPLTGLTGLEGPLQVELVRNTWRFNSFWGTGLLFQAAAGSRAVELSVLENTLEAETSSAAGRQRVGMRLVGQAEGGFKQVRLERNQFAGLNVVLERLQASLLQVLHNTFTQTPGDALSLLPAAAYHAAQAEQAIVVQGNRLTGADRTGVVLVGDADGSKTRVWVQDNQLLNTNTRAGVLGAASSSLNISTVSQLVCTGNRLGSDRAVPTQEYGFAVQGIGVFYETNNELVGALSNLSASVGERLGRITHDGRLKEAYRTTAPTTGTWKAGDRVWNSAPSSRNNLGWVCIGSGTPGAWVPISSSQSAVQVKLHGPFKMSAGQTILTLPEPYQTNRRLLQVFRSGLALSQGSDPAGDDFDWVVESSTSIRFRKPCLQDEVVEVIEFQVGEDDDATLAPPQLFQIQELPSGDIDSTDGFDGNGTFTVSHPIVLDPLPVLKVAGIAELRFGIDYTVDGATLTILPGAKPIAQEWLVITYYYAAS